jgi:hypothetical protein
MNSKFPGLGSFNLFNSQFIYTVFNCLQNTSIPEKFDLKIVQLFTSSNLSAGTHIF